MNKIIAFQTHTSSKKNSSPRRHKDSDTPFPFQPISTAEIVGAGVQNGLRGVPMFATRGTRVEASGRLFFRGTEFSTFVSKCMEEGTRAFESGIGQFYGLQPAGAAETVAGIMKFDKLDSGVIDGFDIFLQDPMRALSNASQYFAMMVDDPNTLDPNKTLVHGVESMGRFAMLIADLIQRYRQKNPASESSKLEAGGASAHPSATDQTPGLSLAERFLQAIQQDGSLPPTKHDVSLLNLFLLTMMGHGCPVSTTAARTIASSNSDLFSAYQGAIGALKGPLHGKANQDVAELMSELIERLDITSHLAAQQTESKVAAGSPSSKPSFHLDTDAVKRELTALLKTEKYNGTLPGFGHGKYTDFDPRHRNYMSNLTQIKQGLSKRDQLILDLYLAVAETGVSCVNEVRSEKGKGPITSFPNVDFLGAFVLTKLGIPPKFFPLMFFMSRIVDATFQTAEQRSHRMVRPSVVNVGEAT